MESFTKTLSLENDKLNVVEAVVLSRYEICFKQIKDIHFPSYASISAIIRNYQLIIPNGLVELQPKDTLFMVTDPSRNKELLEYVQTPRVGGPVSIRKLIESRMKDSESAAEPETPTTTKPAAKKKTAK